WRATRQGITSRRLIETDGQRSGLRAALRFCRCTIGSIVLPLPEKTHPRASVSGSGFELSLELIWRLVTECRVQATAIVISFNERFDVAAQVSEITIVIGVDLFVLERLHEALTTSIVVGVRRPTHARNYLMLLEHLHVFIRGILQAAIGMMDQSGQGLACHESLLQRRFS